MKKFKIIEEGRILSHEEQSKINGGLLEIIETTCTTTKGHNTCSSDWSGSYDYCVKAAAVSGYILTACNGGGGLATCSREMTYESSSCSGLRGKSISCPGGRNY